MKKRLYRKQKNKVLFGVCAGLGDYFGVDPVFIRIIWILTLMWYGTGVIGYILCCFLIPSSVE